MKKRFISLTVVFVTVLSLLLSACGPANKPEAVKATDIAISGTGISQGALQLTVGGRDVLLSATILPANTTDKTVTWSSSDENVVTVSAKGLVHIVGEGAATVTAKTGDVSDSITVVVKAVEITQPKADATRAEIETALAETAWAFYMKDVWIQYDSIDLNTRVDGDNQPLSRWMSGFTRLDNYLSTLEDANSHDTLYSVCSFLPWAVYYEVMDYPLLGCSLNASTMSLWLYAENPDDMLVLRHHNWEENTNVATLEDGYVSHDKCVTRAELEEFLLNWEENLRPGDIFYAIDGHAAMYVGNGWIIESAGHKYNLVTGTDTIEDDGSINAWTVEDYFFNEHSGSMYNLSNLDTTARKRIAILRPLNLLTKDDGDGNPDNDIIDPEYELDTGRLNLQFGSDPNVLRTKDFALQPSAINRVKFPAMNIDKTVNITSYGSALKNGTLTYTISITNESDNPEYIKYHSYGKETPYTGTLYSGVRITEIVPQNATLASAPGAQINGNILTWEVDIPAGATVEVSYIVRVTGNIGDEVINAGGTVADIPTNKITNTIGGRKLNSNAVAAMQAFFDAGPGKWNSNEGYKIGAAADVDTQFAERVYNEAMGLDLQLPSAQQLADILFAQTLIEEDQGMYYQFENSVSRYMYTLRDETANPADQIYRDMLIDGYYGGVWVYTNTYAGNPRIDEMRFDYLEPGDILVYMNLMDSVSGGVEAESRVVEDWRVQVYLGAGQMASLTKSGRLQAIGNHTSTILSAFTYDMFVALRPSQVYADINNDMAPYTGTAPDLTADDEAFKYVLDPSDVLLGDRLAAALAELTPNDGWRNVNTAFAGEVYKAIGIPEPYHGVWNSTYASIMKAIFVDEREETPAYRTYNHAYYLINEPIIGTETIYEMLLYYGGPAFVDKNELKSLEDLHPGDVILLGLRKQRHYMAAVYQGNGKFLTGMQSLPGGAFNYGEQWGALSFANSEEFMNWLTGPVNPNDPYYPNALYEGYIVLRPSRVFDNINDYVLRDLKEGALTDAEEAALAGLNPDKWGAAGRPTNLHYVAPWFYSAAKINVAKYLNQSIYYTYDALFTSANNLPALRTADDEKFNLNYRVMLLDGYYGGSWFKSTGKTTFNAAEFEIGDIFAAAKQVDGSTCYWTAMYQGNGQFLVSENNNNGNIRCFTDSESFYKADFTSQWQYFYVLRPKNLTQLRDMAYAPLTDAEKDVISKLTKEDIDGNKFSNLNGFANQVYKLAGVDTSAYINYTSYWVYNGVLGTPDATKYNEVWKTMLVPESWGGKNHTSSYVLDNFAFEVGDIISGKRVASSSDYWTAIYQGDGNFLVQSSGAKTVSVMKLADIFAAENTWEYYFVMRPGRLATVKAEPAPMRDITTGKLTDAEKAALAGLLPDNWPGNIANLKAVGPWLYSAVNVDISAYITDNIFGAMANLFTYEKESNLTLKEGNTSNYAKMLVEGYYGSREGQKHGKFTAADFQVGDLFCAKGICAGCSKTYYMVAMYQGNGKFLSVVNCGGGSKCVLSCHYDTTTFFAEDFFAQTDAATWDYYFVLRPDQLNDEEPSAPIRDISTGKLTVDEKAALAALTPDSWPGNFANLKGVGPWLYSAVNVDIGAYITDNIFGAMANLFTYEKESNLTLKEGNTSNYAKMLVEGYYGSREGQKHGKFTVADFQVGDLFCAKGICAGCSKTYYMVAVYQGNGQFLSVVNCGGGSKCVLSCHYDGTTIFAEDFFAQTDVATWDYYYVLRPENLAQ